MSAAVVILGISMVIIFSAGCNLKYIVSLIIPGIAGIVALIIFGKKKNN
jgi:cell division protein FtsW (lipid II flippase)